VDFGWGIDGSRGCLRVDLVKAADSQRWVFNRGENRLRTAGPLNCGTCLGASGPVNWRWLNRETQQGSPEHNLLVNCSGALDAFFLGCLGARLPACGETLSRDLRPTRDDMYIDNGTPYLMRSKTLMNCPASLHPSWALSSEHLDSGSSF
jgi:hypothetical protein